MAFCSRDNGTQKDDKVERRYILDIGSIVQQHLSVVAKPLLFTRLATIRLCVLCIPYSCRGRSGCSFCIRIPLTAIDRNRKDCFGHLSDYFSCETAKDLLLYRLFGSSSSRIWRLALRRKRENNTPTFSLGHAFSSITVTCSRASAVYEQQNP
jgi:hypothetical protein